MRKEPRYDTIGIGPGSERTFKRPDDWEDLKLDPKHDFKPGDKVRCLSECPDFEGVRTVARVEREFCPLTAGAIGWVYLVGFNEKYNCYRLEGATCS